MSLDAAIEQVEDIGVDARHAATVRRRPATVHDRGRLRSCTAVLDQVASSRNDGRATLPNGPAFSKMRPPANTRSTAPGTRSPAASASLNRARDRRDPRQATTRAAANRARSPRRRADGSAASLGRAGIANKDRVRTRDRAATAPRSSENAGVRSSECRSPVRARERAASRARRARRSWDRP